jgi:hypothetical protein
MCDQRYESNVMADPELRCPNCAYDLRGIDRTIVTCPECGKRYRIDQLLHQQWTMKLGKAPGLGMLLIPVVLFFVMATTYLSIGIMFTTSDSIEPLGSIRESHLMLIYLVLLSVPWISAVIYASMRMRGGFWLVLLGHLMFLLLLGGIFISIGSGAYAIYLLSQHGVAAALPWLGLMVIAILMIYASRIFEKFMARRCIRHYLNKLAEVSECPDG